jgi:diguanylate cyclase (GGDEF)-like protein
MAKRRGESLALGAFVGGTCVTALAAVIWLLSQTSAAHLLHPTPPMLALAGILILGELRPILISRGEDDGDEITVSSTFALALVLVAPLGFAVFSQVLALIVDDVHRRKELRRILFNISQYTLTLIAARIVFALLTNRAIVNDTHPFTVRDILPTLIAGAAFFLVNNGLTGVVVALATGEPIIARIRDDVRFQVSTSGVLLSFTPCVAGAIDFSMWLLPLLLLPIAAVHRSATLATERERQALHDSLTGLPNRLLLQDRTTRVLVEAARTNASTAVMLIDLDHFKEINDTLGHHVGDQLLQAVASRLRGAMREDDTVARLGGDEFALLASDFTEASEIYAVADRLVDALREPFVIEEVRLQVQASIGIAVSPDHGDDTRTLLQRADVALYTAKEARGRYAFYCEENDEHTLEKLALLGELRGGLNRSELVLHYQPKCDAQSGAVLGMEALVRWAHPTRGLIYPDEFIPIAENTGLIGDLTLEVLNQALRQARTWRDAGLHLGVSVNLSVRSLTDLDLPRQIAGLLGSWGVPPATLTLEVTESTIIVDPSRTMTVLGLLHDLGVGLAVDDFGTGYSSLSYLKRLDPHELKIDKSFVLNMATNSNDAVIVRSTIELGHNLGLRLVAEGVEDLETWTMLQALGCDVIQGYYVSKPRPADEITEWLSEWGRPLPLASDAPANESLQRIRLLRKHA